MYKLIKLEFEPLYPVCDGELIFYTEASTEAETKAAIESIRLEYMRWIPIEEINVIHLGEFKPAYENQFENNVITYQNGNY